MPRNSSGTYSLPAGNPVAPNTLIETAWANPTMSDLGTALTDSLDRFGRGSMLAALKLLDGSAVAPGLSFGSEATLGLYRVGPGQLGVGISGATPFIASSTGVAITGTVAATGGWSGNLTVSGTSTLLGDVGIGAAASAAKLDVLPPAGQAGIAVRVGSGAVARIELAGNNNTVGTTSMLLVQDQTGLATVSNRANFGLVFGTNNVERGRFLPTGQFCLNNAQNFGITGSFYLQVNGSAQAYGDGNGFRALNGTVNGAVSLLVSAGAAGGGTLSGESGPLFFTAGSSSRMQIGTNGIVYVNGVQGLGVGGAFFHQVSGSYLAYGDGNGFRALNTTVNGAAFLLANAGANGGATLSGEAGPISFIAGGSARANIDTAGVLTYGGIEVGYRDAPRVTGGVERGKVFATSAGVTINTGAAGNVISVYNDSAAAITLTQGGGLTLRLGGTTTTGNRTLAARGMATIWYNAAGEAIASGSGVS